MRARLIFAAACLLAPMLLLAQELELQLPSFSSLKAQASQSVNITIGRMGLRMVSWFLHDDDPQSVQVRQALRNLKSVQIRSYEFQSDFVCPRVQIPARWSELVHGRDRKQNENVDIYVSVENQVVKGVAIISCEPREFTIIDVIGTIDPTQIASLQRALKPLGKNGQVGLL
jgi:hypothetical protein